MAWSENEIEQIKKLVNHLSEAYKIALGVSLEFDLQSGDVVVIENQKRVRTISIKDDNPYGALKDITENI